MIFCEYVPILSMPSDDPDQGQLIPGPPSHTIDATNKRIDATALKLCTDTIETLVTL